MNAVTYALLAVVAVEAGDHLRAEDHIRAAQRHSRATARRDRQLIEIASLVVRGERDRARGLSFEHGAEFHDDVELLTSLLDPPSIPGQREG
jgi:hypothetical protein